MNHEHLKAKMDKFFEETSSDHLVAKFKKLGYTFNDTEKINTMTTIEIEKGELYNLNGKRELRNRKNIKTDTPYNKNIILSPTKNTNKNPPKKKRK